MGHESNAEKRRRSSELAADDGGPAGGGHEVAGSVRGERFAQLKSITRPTLVINGSNDVMIPTINLFTLSHIPNAQLVIYPDSSHASLFQYPDVFLRIRAFFSNG